MSMLLVHRLHFEGQGFTVLVYMSVRDAVMCLKAGTTYMNTQYLVQSWKHDRHIINAGWIVDKWMNESMLLGSCLGIEGFMVILKICWVYNNCTAKCLLVFPFFNLVIQLKLILGEKKKLPSYTWTKTFWNATVMTEWCIPAFKSTL